MTQSVQLYLTGPVAERDLLGSLAEFMGIGLETIDFPSDQAQGFVMVMRSGGDYPFGIMISWSDALNLGVDSVGLAQRIAARYGVCVAMDPIQGQDVGRYHEDDPYLWNVVSPSGEVSLYKQASIDGEGLVLSECLGRLKIRGVR